MKRLVAFAASACLCLSVFSGCDFIRTIAGRPTSAELKAKQTLISQYEAEQKAAREIAEAKARAEADSSAAVKAIQEENIAMRPYSGRIVSLDPEQTGFRYFLVLGAFSVGANAEGLAERLREAGCKPVLLRAADGKVLVAGAASDNVADIYSEYSRLKAEDFFPDGVWIMIAE